MYTQPIVHEPNDVNAGVSYAFRCQSYDVIVVFGTYTAVSQTGNCDSTMASFSPVNHSTSSMSSVCTVSSSRTVFYALSTSQCAPVHVM